MPLFEYRCRRCGREFEALVRGEERPACPGCGGRSLAKLLSTFNAGASRTLPATCAGSTPYCEAARCSSGLCPHAKGV